MNPLNATLQKKRKQTFTLQGRRVESTCVQNKAGNVKSLADTGVSRACKVTQARDETERWLADGVIAPDENRAPISIDVETN